MRQRRAAEEGYSRRLRLISKDDARDKRKQKEPRLYPTSASPDEEKSYWAGGDEKIASKFSRGHRTVEGWRLATGAEVTRTNLCARAVAIFEGAEDFLSGADEEWLLVLGGIY